MSTERNTKTPANADSTPWVVKGTSGKPVLTESFTGYSDANSAARKHTAQTGVFAQAVRQ